MLNKLFDALEKLGLGPKSRALHVHFSNQILNSNVYLQRIEGQHTINEGLKAELICLSSHATIPLK